MYISPIRTPYATQLPQLRICAVVRAAEIEEEFLVRITERNSASGEANNTIEAPMQIMPNFSDIFSFHRKQNARANSQIRIGMDVFVRKMRVFVSSDDELRDESSFAAPDNEAPPSP
mmetsp:Transcript_11160/g.41710  ORF Transcript_11160/g.41710 Transcript_11160/m.41710 type:complete len:117 (-) Transcript_11160:405-755(-)